MQNVQDETLFASQSVANVRNIESLLHEKNVALALRQVENHPASSTVFLSLRRRLGQEKKQKIPSGSFNCWILIKTKAIEPKKNQHSLVAWPQTNKLTTGAAGSATVLHEW
jgi:hypothetical protein